MKGSIASLVLALRALKATAVPTALQYRGLVHRGRGD